MKYEYKVIKVNTKDIQEDIDLLNRILKNLDGWEIFKIIFVTRYRDNSGNDFVLHYCRRKIKEHKQQNV